MRFNESLTHILSMITVVVAGVLVCVQTVLALGVGVNYSIFALLLLSLVLMILACHKREQRPPAFDLKSAGKLKLYAFAVAGGFVVEMVCDLLGIYALITGNTTAYGGAGLLGATAVCALLSAFVFVMAALSFGDAKYDFRRLSYAVFVPLFWSMLKMAQALTEYISVGRDLLPTLKLISYIFLMAFFYCFAAESLRHEPAMKSTLFFSGAMFNAGVLYYAAYLSAVTARQGKALIFDIGLMMTVFCVSHFAIFFRRSIVDRC